MKITKTFILGGQLKRILWELYLLVLIKFLPYWYKILISKAKRKDKIKVAFLIQLASSWKYDYIFNLMLKDQRFEPIVIICPIINYENIAMFREIQRAINFFSKKNYPVINSWDEQSQKWINIKKIIKPEIVFFSNPWDNMSRPEYYIFNFLDTLTCYAPYGFKSSHLYEAIFNKPFQNLLWTIFYETEIHKKLALKFARNKGLNGVVTGYPGMDNLLDESYSPDNVWRIKDASVKKIIWAPHHTIFGEYDSNVGFSTFLRYSDFMLRVAYEFKDRIQMSFKPHPLLRSKMYKHPLWGREKTETYFNKWASMINTQLNEGNYIDLFLTSDAMINDGESFMVEYLYTNKPSIFLVADERVTERFNEFGKMVFEHLYQARCEEDILAFINDIVIAEDDYKNAKRVEFFENLVKPPNNKLASENIYNFIKSSISQI